MHNVGFRSRTLIGSYGAMNLRRHSFRCDACQTTATPIDDLLRIDHRLTRTIQKHVCSLTSEHAYQPSRDLLNELLGVDISTESVRSTSQAHGREMSHFQEQDKAIEDEFKQAEGEWEFLTDAGKVFTREGGWKDLKVVVIQKRELAESVPPGSWLEQRLPKATAKVSFAEISPIDAFDKSWAEWLRRLGMEQFADVHVLGDGASWIWKSANQCLTGCEQTLDIFHGCEKFAEAAKEIYGQGTDEAQQSYERGREHLLTRGWTGVCDWVGEEKNLGPTDENKKKRENALAKVIEYFSKHITRMDYAKRLEKGMSIGSGVIEGEVKTLNMRLKCRGAKWNKSNAQAMSALVCVSHSNQWDYYWDTKIQLWTPN